MASAGESAPCVAAAVTCPLVAAEGDDVVQPAVQISISRISPAIFSIIATTPVQTRILHDGCGPARSGLLDILRSVIQIRNSLWRPGKHVIEREPLVLRERRIEDLVLEIPITPDPGDVVMFDMVVQSPKAVCDTCDSDPELGLLKDWKVTVKKA